MLTASLQRTNVLLVNSIPLPQTISRRWLIFDSCVFDEGGVGMATYTLRWKSETDTKANPVELSSGRNLFLDIDLSLQL